VDQKERWELGLKGEIAFWELFREWHPDWFAGGMDKSKPLDSDVDGAVGRCPRDVVPVLDVGCGMLSSMGCQTITGKEVRRLYADPLAEEFRRIAKEQEFALPIDPETVSAENLSKAFRQDSMWVVYSRNAIDHSYHPIRALREMQAVLAPGGFMILKHYLMCGLLNRYESLHQWDFRDEDGRLYISGQRGTQEGVTVPVSALLADCDEVLADRYSEGQLTLVRAIYRKR
jgi:SAM-dependent methyltransferase